MGSAARSSRSMSNLTQRILTSLIAAPIVVALAYLGGWAFVALGMIIAVAAQWEFYALSEKAGAAPMKGVGVLLGALAVTWPMGPYALPVIIAGLLFLVIAELYRRKEQPLLNASATGFGVFYPAGLVSFIVALRVVPELAGFDPLDAFFLVFLLLFSVWGSDIGAYAAGRAFGTHPLFPRVSPKKTWEGAIGGLLVAVAVAVGIQLAAIDFISVADAVVIGLICGIVAPFGDLAESLFKRSVGAKDSASYLPGHGGMLDRIDAAVVAAPLVYFYLDLLAKRF